MRIAAAAACTAIVLLCLPPTQHVRGVAGSSGWSELHLRGGRSAFAPEHPTSRYRDQYVYGMAASGPSDTHGRQTFVREYDVLARLALEGSNAPGFAIQKTRGRPRGSKSWRRGHGKGKNDPSGGWEGQFQELLAFKQRHGHCVVPICRIDLCRRFLRCHDAEEQAGRESGGPLVNTSTDESGSAACPASGDTEDGKQLEHDKLARWVAAQRVFCKRGMLLGKRMARLDGLGFAWQVSPGRKRRHSNILARVSYPNVPTTLEDSALSVSWEDRFAQLVAFRHQHGHCNVPYKSAEHGELGRWVTTQRTFARYGLLRSERKEKLDEIQFVWDLHCTSWSEYYVLLLDFRMHHGHAHVPYRCMVNLASATERALPFLQGVLASAFSRRALAPLRSRGGFNVTGIAEVANEGAREDDEAWGAFPDGLRVRGDASIAGRMQVGVGSRRSGAYVNLGAWVNNQRALRRKGRLSSAREHKLSSVGMML